MELSGYFIFAFKASILSPNPNSKLKLKFANVNKKNQDRVGEARIRNTSDYLDPYCRGEIEIFW